MVIRDRDVLEALRDRAGATVCVSLTTLDRELWRRLEPGTSPPHQRLRAVAALAGAGIQVGVLLAPIVPGLTTDRGNLEAVVRGAAEHGAAFVGAGVLHLEPGVREHFDTFLRAEAPELTPLYRRLYPGPRAPAGVERSLGNVVAELREQYGLAERPRMVPARAGGGADARSGPPARAASQLSLRL
jgi:DNA repair photolyase